jgi:hypothetical protein
MRWVCSNSLSMVTLTPISTNSPQPMKSNLNLEWGFPRRRLMPHRSMAISAENNFTSFLQLRSGDRVSISVSGSFTGKVTLQRSFDGVSDYHDVPNPDS